MSWLLAPGHRAGVVALGGTLALVGLIVVVGVAGGTGRFTPLPLPHAGDSGAGTDGPPTAGQESSAPDPRESSAPSSPTTPTAASPSSTSRGTSEAPSGAPVPVGQPPTPASPPTTLDTSVKHPRHHGKPPWSGGGPSDGKSEVSP